MIHSRRFDRRERGHSLLIATSLVTLVTVGTLASLKVVSTEADIQGQRRRERVAFYAAQAGLAEARERMGILAAQNGMQYPIDPALGLPAGDGLGSAADPWYDVLCQPGGDCSDPKSKDRWIRYDLAVAGSVPADRATALDQGEMRDRAGLTFRGYPTNEFVYYRVLLRDDDDGTPKTNDVNRKVWLIAIGEVRRGENDDSPVRSVIQTLITTYNAPALDRDGITQAHAGASKLGNLENPDKLVDVLGSEVKVLE